MNTNSYRLVEAFSGLVLEIVRTNEMPSTEKISRVANLLSTFEANRETITPRVEKAASFNMSAQSDIQSSTNQIPQNRVGLCTKKYLKNKILVECTKKASCGLFCGVHKIKEGKEIKPKVAVASQDSIDVKANFNFAATSFEPMDNTAKTTPVTFQGKTSFKPFDLKQIKNNDFFTRRFRNYPISFSTDDCAKNLMFMENMYGDQSVRRCFSASDDPNFLINQTNEILPDRFTAQIITDNFDQIITDEQISWCQERNVIVGPYFFRRTFGNAVFLFTNDHIGQNIFFEENDKREITMVAIYNEEYNVENNYDALPEDFGENVLQPENNSEILSEEQKNWLRNHKIQF